MDETARNTRRKAMHRRTFCKSALAAGVAASLAGYSGAAPDKPGGRGAAIPAISSTGAELSIETAAVAELAAALQGRLYLQGDEGYAGAKTVWNGMFDHKRPAIVAQCESSADVVNAVDFARQRNLLVSVKGGGHSLPGKSTSDGGMMIDLSRMHAVEIDADTQRLRAGGGALLGHLDRAALAQELMTTTGIVSHTGVGGFTLGGGFGRTDRKMGLAIDNLLAATVVTAAGDVVHASDEENPDLFWGLRGGGGNFGIVTEFVYRLHPFNPTVFGGNLVYPLSKDFLAFYAEFNETLPDEANLEPQLIPNDEGKPVIVAQATWCGDHAAGAKALAPLREFPGLLRGELGPRSYQSIQTADDEFLGHGRQYYLKSGLLNELTPDAIDVIVEYAGRGGPASWFQHLGGASSRVAPDATAYPHRDAAFNFGIMYIGDDPAGNAGGQAAVREYYAAMQPHMAGFYTNLNEDSADRTRGNYGTNYPRLVGLKNRYDPTNLFRLNANIQPTA
jgi:FAD/FMN-containing dehydrogenase